MEWNAVTTRARVSHCSGYEIGIGVPYATTQVKSQASMQACKQASKPELDSALHATGRARPDRTRGPRRGEAQVEGRRRRSKKVAPMQWCMSKGDGAGGTPRPFSRLSFFFSFFFLGFRKLKPWLSSCLSSPSGSPPSRSWPLSVMDSKLRQIRTIESVRHKATTWSATGQTTLTVLSVECWISCRLCALSSDWEMFNCVSLSPVDLTSPAARLHLRPNERSSSAVTKRV